MRSVGIGALALVVLAGCEDARPGRLEVEAPYARASAPGAPHGAAFMRLRAVGGAVEVVGGRADASEVVELHEHAEVGGVMKMRPVPKITIPAGEVVELEPGGLHVMLLQLHAPLEPGDEVALTLELESGQTVGVKAPVRALEGQGAHERPGPASRPAGSEAPATRPAGGDARR